MWRRSIVSRFVKWRESKFCPSDISSKSRLSIFESQLVSGVVAGQTQAIPASITMNEVECRDVGWALLANRPRRTECIRHSREGWLEWAQGCRVQGGALLRCRKFFSFKKRKVQREDLG